MRVEEGYGVRVLRAVGRGVGVGEGVGCVGLGAILREEVGFVVLDLVCGGLEKECCGSSVVGTCSQQARLGGLLGSASSNMAS